VEPNLNITLKNYYIFRQWHKSCFYASQHTNNGDEKLAHESLKIVKRGIVMPSKKQKPLSADICLKCFVCNEHEARHMCIFEWGELNVKLCLCPQCVKMSEQYPEADMFKKVA
jgi:hypothetical protein